MMQKYKKDLRNTTFLVFFLLNLIQYSCKMCVLYNKSTKKQ